MWTLLEQILPYTQSALLSTPAQRACILCVFEAAITAIVLFQGKCTSYTDSEFDWFGVFSFKAINFLLERKVKQAAYLHNMTWNFGGFCRRGSCSSKLRGGSAAYNARRCLMSLILLACMPTLQKLQAGRTKTLPLSCRLVR